MNVSKQIAVLVRCFLPNGETKEMFIDIVKASDERAATATPAMEAFLAEPPTELADDNFLAFRADKEAVMTERRRDVAAEVDSFHQLHCTLIE